VYFNTKILDSLVGITAGYELDDRGSIAGRDKRFFLFNTASRPALGPTHPPVQWISGALSPGVKGLGREADHSAPSNVEVKNGGSIPLLPHMS
jgi:hypothetical protein